MRSRDGRVPPRAGLAVVIATVDAAVFLHLTHLWSWQLFIIDAGSKILAGALITATEGQASGQVLIMSITKKIARSKRKS